MVSPFSNANDLEEYLNHCERTTLNATSTSCSLRSFSRLDMTAATTITNTAPTATYPMPHPHHPSMYYGGYHHPPQCFYRPPAPQADMNSYYYGPSASYSNAPQLYPYNHPQAYYHPSANPYGNADQFQHYYYQSHSTPPVYAPPTNSNMDIPSAHNSSHHRTYRQMSANMSSR